MEEKRLIEYDGRLIAVPAVALEATPEGDQFRKDLAEGKISLSVEQLAALMSFFKNKDKGPKE